MSIEADGGPPRGRSRLAPVVLVIVLLAAASLACSVGGALGGSNGGPTPTKTRRATFTPLPGALTTAAVSSNPVVRGMLPPGVTVEAVESTPAPGAATTGPGTPGSVVAGGETNLLIYATNTPTPSPVPTQRPPTWTPVESIAEERPAAQPTPFVVIKPAALNGRRGPGAAYEKVGEAKKGQELFILGRTQDGKWLQVCCMANQPVWVAADQVQAQGAVETAAILTPPPVPLPTPTPTRARWPLPRA